MKTYEPKRLLDGVVFGEGPRWHAGKLWFSDIFASRVMTVDPSGRSAVVCTLEARPSGLGWDTQGRLLVVSMNDRKLVRWHDGRFETVADLSSWATGNANDMVVGPDGRAYIGNFGYDLFAGGEPKPAAVGLVEPVGSTRAVAEDLQFPNGMVLFPDRKTLVVAESFGNCLTAFNVKPDGSLSGRRLFAHLADRVPDGICLDAEGAIWVSCFGQDEFIRVVEGGDIEARVAVTGRRAVACALGGEDRKTLFLCTAETTVEDLHEGRSKGWIETASVEVPGAGWP